MVPPRYGAEVVGGAENLMGALARRSAEAGIDVEVATTCASSNETWANDLPSGATTEGGVVVHRFRVTPRDVARHRLLTGRLALQGRLSPLDEADLLATSVWSGDLQRFIDHEGPGYDAVVFTPYLLGTTFWGAQSWPDRTAIIPCLHDEPWAYLPSIQSVLRSSAVLLFNARGEERLARRLLGDVRGTIVGMGFDPPVTPAPADFAVRHGLDRYVLYAGRLEQGKRVHVAAQYVADFARRHDPSLRLVTIGAGGWEPPADVAGFVRAIGFVPGEEKRAAMAGALALVNPSEMESLSIVILEAWLEGTPVIVAAGSEVMADHCADAGGGFTFADQPSFDEALASLLESETLRREMGARGHAYVRQRYAWPEVLDRFQAAISRVGAPLQCGGCAP